MAHSSESYGLSNSSVCHLWPAGRNFRPWAKKKNRPRAKIMSRGLNIVARGTIISAHRAGF